MGNANESEIVLLTVEKYSKHFKSIKLIIDHLSINIWVIIRPQDYEVTFLEEHNALHKLILMEKSSLSSQNFNQSVVKILSIHKTNWIKKEKAKGKKCDRRRLREILRTLQRWRRGRLKRFGAGQERRCGKWIRINISSSIAWLLRKNVPIIQSCPAVNGACCILLFLCNSLWSEAT